MRLHQAIWHKSLDMADLLEQYAIKMYPEAFPDVADQAATSKDGSDSDDDEELDIEAAVKSEIKEAKGPQKQIFKTVRIDVACGRHDFNALFRFGWHGLTRSQFSSLESTLLSTLSSWYSAYAGTQLMGRRRRRHDTSTA